MEEEDIIELEKRYWQLRDHSPRGKVDVETLMPLISPPLPESVVQGVLDAFDENRDGHIDFKEMACGISAAARGPPIERQKCMGFKIIHKFSFVLDFNSARVTNFRIVFSCFSLF